MNRRLEKGRSQRCPSAVRLPVFWTLIRQMALLFAIGLLALEGSQQTAAAAPQDAVQDTPAAAQASSTAALPALLAPDAEGVIVLFTGKAEELAQNFTRPDGTAPTWAITSDGAMQAQDADIMTKQGFGDCQLHVEFKIPLMADAVGQARGNSGIVLHGRFEMQILDSYGNSQPGAGDCGAVYNLQAPLVNACKAPNEWQSYDIIFRAPRLTADGKSRLQAARVTAFLNGALVQNNTEILGPTGSLKIGEPGKPAPFLLQYHGSAVEFRNIWILPLSQAGKAPVAAAEIANGADVVNWHDVEEGEKVPVERVLFDQGGYQVHCGGGETIVVPFTDENLNTMKFGRSGNDTAYFVNESSTPTLYLSNTGYLESAVAEDTKWYPFAPGYNYTSPVYVGLAPSYRDYTTMGWYPGMEVYGGVLGSTRGATVTWMPGYYTSIKGARYPTYKAYRLYLTRKTTYAHNRVVFGNYAVRPAGPRSIIAGRGTPVNGGAGAPSPGQPRIQPVAPVPFRPGHRQFLPVPPKNTRPGPRQIQRSIPQVPFTPVQRLPVNPTPAPVRNRTFGGGSRIIRPTAPVIRPSAPVVRRPPPAAPPRSAPNRRRR